MHTQFVQHAFPTAQLLVIGPLKRWWSRGKAITQEELNSAHLGPNFTIGKRLAVQLNILFSCFFYSSGMPALLLLAAFSFGLAFVVDKVLMLRLYKQPPQFDAALARLATSIMTWAIIFHLAMAIYMLGEDSVRPPCAQQRPMGRGSPSPVAACAHQILKSDPISASLVLSLAGSEDAAGQGARVRCARAPPVVASRAGAGRRRGRGV